MARGRKSSAQTTKVKNKYIEWLALYGDKTPAERRLLKVPETKTAFAAKYGYTRITLHNWEKDFESTDIMGKQETQNLIEWEKCKEDFPSWVNDYCWMWVKEGGDPVPFKLWEFQWDAAEKMQYEKYLIILKARQMGLSWLVSAYTLWSVMFTPNFHAYYTSIGLKEVQEQMERIRFIFHQLPEWMQNNATLGGRGCKDNDSLMQFTNGSAIHATASGKSAGHGSSPGLFICDEWARVENPVEKWRAIKPSLGTNSKLFLISTSDGVNNHFADTWFGAVKEENGFTPVFYAANQHPDYTEEWLEQVKLDFAGDVQGYMMSYPMTPKDAFLSAARSIFDHERIADWKEYIREGKVYPEMGYVELEDVADSKFPIVNSRGFIPDQMGHMAVWKFPIAGHTYTMGADVAQGIIGGDWSVAAVYDTVTREIVALFRAKIHPEQYAYPLENIARYYNNAWLVVEVNTASEIIMSDLKAVYPWLYRRQYRERIQDAPTMIPGFYTSSTSKPRIITNMRRLFSDQEFPLRIYSDVVLDEMATFEQVEGGRSLEAAKGHHDDCVMAVALALEGETTMPYTDDTFGALNYDAHQYTWRSL